MRNRINEAHEAEEEISSEPSKRKLVIPGEVIVTGEDFLPGEGAKRDGEDVISLRFGLAEEIGKVVKVIPIFGAFIPRRNNVVIGRVSDITYSGWLVDIDCAGSAFLPIEEFPRYVNKSEMAQHLAIGDVVAAKIWSVSGKSIDLAMKGRGLGPLQGGFIFHVTPARVPRVIGREGSMITLIKEKTGCDITVGQNGWIWVKGADTDSEIRARKAIEFVTDKAYIEGLTDKMEDWFKKN